MSTARWFAFGPFRLDTQNGQLYRQGQAIKLRRKTLAVLALLTQRAGDVVTRAEIIDAVWPDVSVQEEILTTSIAELRRALGDTRKNARYIETIHGRGVRFIADVRVSHSADTASAAEAAPFDHAAATRLIGRQQPLAELRRCLDAVFAGSKRVAVVRGQAGIGKTRLVQELAAIAATRGARVLQASADDDRSQTVFGIWTQIVRAYANSCDSSALRTSLGAAAAEIAAVMPSLQDSLGTLSSTLSIEPGLARARFFNGMTAFVRHLASQSPLLLVFDDLQDASAGSLSLLGAVVDSLRSDPVLVLVGQRSGDKAHNPALADLIDSWQRAGELTSIELSGLTEVETQDLIASATNLAVPPALVQRIANDTAGNPYFVLEIISSLDERTLRVAAGRADAYEIPATILRGIENRLHRVSDQTRRFLRSAAVAGSTFDAHVVAHAAALPPKDILHVVTEAETAGFIDECPTSAVHLVFAHDLVRDTLLQGLAKLERAELHNRVGLAIEELGGATAHNVMQLAYHFGRAGSAGDVHKAITYGSAAGRQALERHSNDEAFELLRRALQLAESGRPPDDELFEILELLAEAHVRLGRGAPAPGGFEEMVADRLHSLATAQARPAWLAKSAMAIARSYMPYRQRIADKPVVALEQALRAVGEDNSLLYGHTAARLAAVLLGFADRNERRIELARQAVAIARATRDPQDKVNLLQETLICFWDPDHLDERMALADELEEACRIARNPYAMASPLTWQAFNLMAVGRFRDASAAVERAQTLASDLHLLKTQRYALRFRVHLAILRGRFEEVARLTSEFSQLAPHAMRATTQFETIFTDFSIKREKGTLSDVPDLVRAIAPQFPQFALRLGLPYFLVELGDLEQARRELELLVAKDLSNLPPRNEVTGWLPAVAVLADVCAELADSARTPILYRLLEPYAKQWAIAHFGIAIIAAVERCLGRLAATMGAKDRAAAHFENVIAVCEREEVVTELARSQLHYAQAIELDQPRGSARSQQLRAAAVELARTYGLDSILQRVQR